ncbi:methyltransferase domain-containing protein [Spirochaeta isovalerica]|uniref:Ubiquinone/menaquinone biosynthesis C-methylase UbiE n=1 Tax=Spirochaeta isovalerica TaxID=150 RepID=A0A841R9X9_9SPIO|nr:ubiquinone/menaquinone biosynthesis C-methylase UbiE [Spirochaeta isovalerica]
MERKFNPDKLARLNDPVRLEHIPPDFIREKLGLNGCSVMADIGAGTGLFTKAFLELCGGGKAFSADISPVMVDWMKENLIPEKGEIIPLLVEEKSLPIDSDSVDLAIMFNLYHELEAPDQSLAEVMRILKKGGKICIADWKKGETPSGPPQKIRVSADEISEALRNTGFQSIWSDDSLPFHSLVWAVK